MSQSSLKERFEDLGVIVKRGVKVPNRGEGKQRDAREYGSDLWLLRWANNSYRNYELVTRAKLGVSQLVQSAVGVPSIVVGIGPSLDESIKYLSEASGKALIIATDAAFRPLMAKGVRPDLVLSFDCKPEQGLLWQSVPDHDVPILFDSCAHPDTIASWKGPVVFYNHYHQTDELSQYILPHVFPHIGQLPSGGTVGNVAILLSKVLGGDPSIVVGFDFCYGKSEKGWRYRAADYIRVPTGSWIQAELKDLYDNDERVVRSFERTYQGVTYRQDPELEYYYKTFLSFLPHFKIKAINTAMEGALKDSVESLPLDLAIKRFCPKDADLSSFRSKFDGYEDPRRSK